MAMKTESVNKGKGGRPRKYDEVTYWGMKLSLEDKEKIKTLAKKKAKSASALVMDLVNKALDEDETPVDKPKKITVYDLKQMSKQEQSKIVESHAKLAAKHFEFDEDFDEFYEE